MNYGNAREILEKIEHRGSIYGLETMEMLMNLLSSPQDKLKIIHVGGTNGKGSLIAYLSNILMQAGYNVGTYTSPAVFLKCETICVAGNYISKQQYTILFEKVLEASGKLKSLGYREATAFEIETAIAFMYFYEQKCDIVLLEVGLGGDLDATNIINSPLCSVIMPISIDHTNLLGDSLAEIAMHKAGIIKRNTPVVSALQDGDVFPVLEERAALCDTLIFVPGRYQMLEESQKNIIFDSDFSQKFIYNEEDVFEISMPGVHQVENAAVAIEVVNVLREQGFVIDDSSLKSGLRHTQWAGRFSVINRKPYVIIDGAHNLSAAKALNKMLQMYFFDYFSEEKRPKLIIVAGMLNDKNYREIIPIVTKRCDMLITISTNIYNRNLSGNVLKEIAKEENIPVTNMENAADSVREAMRISDKNDVILSFGSFTFLAQFEAEIKKYMEKIYEKN